MGEVHHASKAKRRVCDICCHAANTFCIGECNHPICFVCGTRIRVVCENSECPICRRVLEKIYFINDADNCDGRFVDKAFIADPFYARYGFHFENEAQIHAVAELLANMCEYCGDRKEFKNFKDLERHLHRIHQLSFCDICVKNLKLFPRERKCYTYRDLARHRRAGDPDDSSHKGHPRCEFCDERFMDDDQLFRHLRINHFMCHFCDADGYNRFFSTNVSLRAHFKEQHFLCEEGECKSEPIGVAFGTEIDFKAHRASVHSREFTKSQLKIERQVKLDFAEPNERRKKFDPKRKGRPEADPPSAPVPDPKEFSLVKEDFPTLGCEVVEKKPDTSKEDSFKQVVDVRPKHQEEDAVFILGTVENKSNSVTPKATELSDKDNAKSKAPVSIGTFGTPWSANKHDHSSFEEQFPALQSSGSSLIAGTAKSGGDWVKPSPQLHQTHTSRQQKALQNVNSSIAHLRDVDRATTVSSSKPALVTQSLNDFPPLPSGEPVVRRTFRKDLSSANGSSDSRTFATPPPPPGFSSISNPVSQKCCGSVSSSFITPFDFEERNRSLSDRIQREFDEERLLRFKRCNGYFRTDDMSAQDYCLAVCELMGHRLFVALFPELLCLLPDVVRQNQLLTAYNAMCRHGRFETLTNIIVCKLCNQVLMLTDLPDHKIHHQQP